MVMHWILPTTHALCMVTRWGGHRWEFSLHAGSPSRGRQPSPQPESHLPGVTQGNPHLPGFRSGWAPFLSCAFFFRLKWLPKEAFHCAVCLPMSSSGCHPPDLELSCPAGLIPDVGLSLARHLSADQVQFPHSAPSESAWDPRMGVGMWMVAIVSPS